VKNFEKIRLWSPVAVSIDAFFVAILSFYNSKLATEISFKSKQPDVRIFYTITNKLYSSEAFGNVIRKKCRVILSDFYKREKEESRSPERNFWYLWLVFHNTGAGYASDLKIKKIKYKFEREDRVCDAEDIRIDTYACDRMGDPDTKIHDDEVFALLVQCFESVNSQGKKINPLKYIKGEMGFEGFKTTFYHSDLYDKEYRFEDEETAKKPWPNEHIPID